MAKLGANPRPLKWDAQQLDALTLTFEGRLTWAQIAERVGSTESTIKRWAQHPDFQAKLQAKRDDLIAALDHKPYIRKERRLVALAEMAEAARVEFERRPWLQEVRQVGRDPETGEPLTLTNESFNRDAHAAFREALADIAAELGARKQVTEVTGKNGGPIAYEFTANPELAAHARALLLGVSGGTGDASGPGTPGE